MPEFKRRKIIYRGESINKEEFNYMSKCLIATMNNLESARTIKEVYYQKGIIRTLEDILYKYADDNMINKLNHMIINSRCEY